MTSNAFVSGNSSYGVIAAACTALVAIAFVPTHAQGLVSVGPGEEAVITHVDGGDRECRQGGSDYFENCIFGGFLSTHADPAGNFLRSRSHASLTLLTFSTASGEPNYATTWLYADIIVDGPHGTFVPVSLSAIFDYNNFFFLGASYLASSSVSLRVVDLHTGLTVAKKTLFETNRDGDQGFTDVALSDQRLVLLDAAGDLEVLLRRGRQYRVFLDLEVMTQVLAVGVVEADATATWKSVTIRVDEDEAEMLGEHDIAVRAALSDHDSDVKQLLEELLENQAELREGQLEIIRLLLTPQGRRSSEMVGDFPQRPESPEHPDTPGQTKKSAADSNASAGQSDAAAQSASGSSANSTGSAITSTSAGGSCGLGAELAFFVPLFLWRYRGRGSDGRRASGTVRRT